MGKIEMILSNINICYMIMYALCVHFKERGLDIAVTRGEEYDTKQGANGSIYKKS
ncbi:unnamed protein product [Lupinus luteus]|uniref:Uncharacterized protein n=1 Tax=Lupinus luteus TaxID=3873 RepID=A0AAV1VXA1_LUPLU